MKFYYKNAIGKMYLISGILCFINGIATKIFAISFSNFFLALSIPLLALGTFELLFFKQNTSKLIKKLISIIHIGTLLFLISFIVVESLILTSTFAKETNKPDYIVILGAGLRGETPSLILYNRLEASINIINTYKDTKIILSGGQGPGESISEAEAMKRYLLEKGVAPHRIFKEDKSTNTFENLVFTKNLIETLGVEKAPKITIVTSNFHMFRSKLLAKRVGLDSYSYSAKVHAYLTPTFAVREYIAIIKTLIFDWP